MNLKLIGVNHRTAPVEVRERFAVYEHKLPEALQCLVQHPGVNEGLIVSTCNRVEILAGLQNGSCDLRGHICKYFGITAEEFDKYT
jgi:glutamyl-tRNA reductase